ncbi:ribonuclease R [Culicoidibacter larvae]|uniref:Ribonuclease R n=1 Tax=Culicoidibacter larvae TaxID=2579976 RepID=A0A5R8QGP8_9FIRM|nr:ribonuclease R [Culicoidibacter larvae]TLG77219.1 ribonuclease R [Culicoidibacter larvae]
MNDWQEKILAFMQAKEYVPMERIDMAEEMEIVAGDDYKQFLQALVSLEDKHIIYRSKRDRYVLAENMQIYAGTFIAHEKGMGFVRPDNKEIESDFFIPPNEINGAFHGDHVLIQVYRQGNEDKRAEAKVIDILERSKQPIVGELELFDKDYFWLVPDEKRMLAKILVRRKSKLSIMDGHKVVVVPKEYRDNGIVIAEVQTILGHKNDPGVDILSIIYKHGIPVDFEQAVLDEAAAVSETLAPEDYIGRRDLRNNTIITIDGEDAKDLDDAVEVERLDNGNYRLGVHIADVSHYVQPQTALSRSAYDRGTSVYLVDRVVPMLPHRLSNGICSLNPHVDRLTLSCDMEIDDSGKVVNYDIYASVIQTTERMTYTNVNKIIAGDDELVRDRYKVLLPMIENMHQLAQILQKKRTNRGAIEFDIPESKISVDKDGKPLAIGLRERGISERIIEQFMLEANETIATHFYWLQLPFIYRVHEEPNPKKLDVFRKLASNLGYRLHVGNEEVHPKALQEILHKAEHTPEEGVISSLLLRSMQKARYAPECLGHYGLAAQYYTHFTSPIRRYPDLIVHRLIHQFLLEQRTDVQELERWQRDLPEIAANTSYAERRAIDCERDVDAMKKAEFMMDYIGEEFDGIISSVTSFGMFIELPNTVEGLVHVVDLTDDHYEYVPEQLLLRGLRTKKQFKIGDAVRIIVTAADKDTATVDFAVVGMKANRPKKRVAPSPDGKRKTPFKEQERFNGVKKKRESKRGTKAREGSRHGGKNHRKK